MKELAKEKNALFPTILSPFVKSSNFTVLFFGQLLSVLGTSITSVILPVIVLQMTQSTAAMGLVMTIFMLPYVLILPFSGLIVDRINRVKIMLLTDFVRFGVLGLFAFLALSKLLNMPWLYAIVAILGLMDGLFQPAYAAVRAKVFTPDIRNAANSITQVSMQGIRLLGPSLGGLILTYVSAGVGLGIESITFLLSFVSLLFLKELSFKRRSEPTSNISFKTDFIEGVAVLKTHSWLWVTILAFSIINICSGGVMRILVPWLINIHHGFEPYVYGLMLSSSGAGAILCALAYGSRQHWNHKGKLAYGGIAAGAAAMLMMPFVSNIPVLMLLMLLNGAGTMLFGLIWEISLQDLVPEEKFGRVVSLDMLGSFALLPLGYMLTGWFAERIGEITTMVSLSVFIFLIVAVSMLSKGVRDY